MPPNEIPTFPSMADLTRPAANQIPSAVLQIVRERYIKHSGEYISKEIHGPSGKPYNECMFADTLQDCEDEIVDAIFNAMVYNLRSEMGAVWPPSRHLVTKLCEAWDLVQLLKGVDRYK